MTRRMTRLVAALTFALLVGCSKADPPAPAAPNAHDLAMVAARAAFQLPPVDDGSLDLSLTGDEGAAIAREKRAGICSLLFVGSDGAWHEQTKFKGKMPDAALAAPLKSAGTIQEGVTRNDIQVLAGQMCK